jgi:hypothetical protein
MDSLHEIRIGRERLQDGSVIALEEEVQISLSGIEIGELQLGHVVLQVAPDPLDRVQLGAIQGRKSRRTFAGSVSWGEVCAPLLSNTRIWRLSGKACAKASPKSWTIAVFK